MNQPSRPHPHLQKCADLAAASLLALILLCVSWEMWLAPLRPGGSGLVFKAVPLLFPLFGLLRGRRYTFKWTTLFALAYVAEGAVRFASDSGLSRWLALVELLLALSLFVFAIATVRLSRSEKPAGP
jgi:uncharacterized membrane protein